MIDSAWKKIPLIGLLGFGRSGCTLLEQMLGSMDGHMALGETEMVHAVVHMYEGKYQCACGAAISQCPVWGAIVKKGGSSGLREKLAAMHGARKKLRACSLRELRLGRWLPGSPAHVYEQGLKALYGTLREGLGEVTFIDSGKNPRHACLLSLSGHFQVQLIHIVRDPRAVAFSWKRLRRREDILQGEAFMAQYEYLDCARRWAKTHAFIEQMKKKIPVLQIRYEDLVLKTRDILKELAAFLGNPRVARLAGEGGEVRTNSGHLLLGNPSKRSDGTTVLKLDDEWTRELASEQKRGIEKIVQPYLGLYGYAEQA